MQGSNTDSQCIPKEPAIFKCTTYKKEENNDKPKENVSMEKSKGKRMTS